MTDDTRFEQDIHIDELLIPWPGTAPQKWEPPDSPEALLMPACRAIGPFGAVCLRVPGHAGDHLAPTGPGRYRGWGY